MAHSALSEVWEHLGYEAKARAESQRALELSGHLSPEERLAVEGQYREVIHDWPKAIEAYRSLFDLFPDNLAYGLRLAAAQRWVKPADSLHTLAVLRLLPAPAGDDPRIDLVEASSTINQDFMQAQAAAKRAIAKGTALGSHWIVGRAYGILCQQGSAIGVSMEEIKSDCENARQSSAAAGDRDNEARTLNDSAGIYFFQGDLARAETMWSEAAAKFRQVGDPEGMAAALNNRGDVFLLQGNLSEARKRLKDAIPGYQAIEDKDGVALALNDLGDLSRREGHLEAAVTTYEQARATAQEIDDKNAMAYVLIGLGDIFPATEARGRSGGGTQIVRRIAGAQNSNGWETGHRRNPGGTGSTCHRRGPRRRCRRLSAREVQTANNFVQEQQADDELAGEHRVDCRVARARQAGGCGERSGIRRHRSRRRTRTP